MAENDTHLLKELLEIVLEQKRKMEAFEKRLSRLEYLVIVFTKRFTKFPS